ncbi:MAG: hypothetical protein LLF75_11855 [Eubacteriales bacterium]|nr:hypothetical protein [Eubacteriales bacterium]
MKGIRTWVLGHKLLVGVLLLFIQPLLVHLFLLIPAPFKFLERSWEAGDLITYIAGFEVFVGIVLLRSTVTEHNKRSIDMNDRLLKIEEMNRSLPCYPNLMVEDTQVLRTTLYDTSALIGRTFWSQDLAKEVELIECTALFQEPINYYSFSLRNLSNFNVTLHVEDLELHSWLKERPPVLYDTKDIGLDSNDIMITPGQSTRMGFVVFDFESSLICDANMNIIVEKNRNERYKFTIGLQILNTPTDNHFRIGGEKIYPLL